MITLNHRYTIHSAEGTISGTGIQLIRNLITSVNPREQWQDLNPGIDRHYLPSLPLDWQWQWMVTDGPYVGRFPKRVGKFYHEQGIKCPESFLSEIGNLARSHADEDVVYQFEFVDQFEWRAGDFGDYGSCYWGSNAGAKDMLIENGGWAVLFYDNDGNGQGRAWFVNLTDLYIVFNGYGMSGDATLTITRVLAGFMKLSYKRISVENYNQSGGLLWINGGMGYAIGKASELEHLMHYDFEWDGGVYCYSCDDDIHGDAYIGADDNTYCENCFYEIFDTCEWCGETHWLEDLNLIDDRYLCTYCTRRQCQKCARCRDWHFPRNLRQLKDRVFCERCYRKAVKVTIIIMRR